MPSPAPEPLASRPLSVWLVNPYDDIPGEGLPPLRYWTLARVLAARGHDVIWWTATWSHSRKAIRSAPLGIRDDEGFAVRLVAVRPYEKNVSLARLGSHRDFGKTFERLANESISSGQLERPDIILASLPPLDGPEAAARLATKLDATFVLDVMDVWPETFERLVPGPAFLKRLIAPFLLGGMQKRRKALLASADAVSAATHTYASAVLRDASAELPRHVCYVGAYPQEFPTDLDVLAGAAWQLSAAGVKATIHVAGTGALEQSLRRSAAALSGSCRMEVHGLLSRQGYVNLLARCDVGLVCVKPESLVAVPYKACDFAAAGLAIVNSLPGELQKLIDEHGAGVAYTAGDAGSLTRAITGFATDRSRLNACRQGARQLATAEFDRERTYPKFADWLETVSE